MIVIGQEPLRLLVKYLKKKLLKNMFHAETKILSLPLRVIVRVDVQQIILPIVEMVVQMDVAVFR